MTQSDFPSPAPFTAEEEERISKELASRLDVKDILQRNTGGGMAPYVEGHVLVRTANSIFGFNKWTNRIIELTTDYCDASNERYSAGCSCITRITLSDGTFHEDVGYGSCENVKTRAMALEKSKKQATTDAFKRCCRLFGDKLGNCCYDKEFTNTLPKPAGGAPQGGGYQAGGQGGRGGYQPRGGSNSRF
ncbi:MAG: DNA repair and recombination protein RAD52/RAD22 [Amphiamblys sp. WSBS2006]|nr:MAG: DNA repair and recombination protein RAD52/RAD22 [Amphiamblys sp. WSBS2006]